MAKPSDPRASSVRKRNHAREEAGRKAEVRVTLRLSAMQHAAIVLVCSRLDLDYSKAFVALADDFLRNRPWGR